MAGNVSRKRRLQLSGQYGGVNNGGIGSQPVSVSAAAGCRCQALNQRNNLANQSVLSARENGLRILWRNVEPD